MRRITPLLLLAAACAAAPAPFELLSVSPPDTASVLGARLSFTGLGLLAAKSAALVASGRRIQLANARALTDVTAEATLPPGAPAGLYDLEWTDAAGAKALLPASFRVSDGELRIEVADVGQGDGAYVLAPNGKALVIDGGRARGDRDSIVPTLVARGLAKPEMVLVSHFDADHLGGIVSLLQGPDGANCTPDDRAPPLGLFDYARDWSTCNSALCVDYYRLRECNAARIAGGAGARVPSPGDKLPLGGGVEVEVVAVNGGVGGGVFVPTGTDNGNSIGLRIRFGAFTYLTAGDLTGGPQEGCFPGADDADVESALATRATPVEVLHVNHHGSCTSSNPAFLKALAPQAAVISVGENNPYGHPEPGTLARVAGAAGRLFLTGPGITQAAGPFPRTRLPDNAEPAFGPVRIRTKDGANYVVEVLDAQGAPAASRAFIAR